MQNIGAYLIFLAFIESQQLQVEKSKFTWKYVKSLFSSAPEEYGSLYYGSVD